MIVFRNPGLIDLTAVTTMGVNVKESPTAFGYFGTGLKYALATILRGDGSVIMWRGRDSYDFRVDPRTIRGVEFGIVQMHDPHNKKWTDLGFTTQLGKNWQPWMVLRELGCNCLDEGGDFFGITEPDSYCDDDTTVFIVDWPALDEVMEKEHDAIFCDNRPEAHKSKEVQVLEGEASYIFYRGIRAYKLQYPSAFTYNILSEQSLTEDRTLASVYYAMGEIRKLWLECEDKELLRAALAPEGERLEHEIDYTQTNREPSKEFLDTVLDLRGTKGMKARINKSATAVLHRHLRSSKTTGVGWASSRFMQDEFSAAMEAISEIFEEDQLRLNDDLPLVLLEDNEMEDHGLAFLEKDRIYVARSLLKKGRREIVSTLLPLIMEVRFTELMYTSEVAALFVPILMNNHPDLRQHGSRVEHMRIDEEEEDPGLEAVVADADAE